MAFNLTTIMTELGSLIYTTSETNTFRGTTLTNRITGIESTIAGNDPADAAAYFNLLAPAQASLTSFLTGIQSVAQNIIINAAGQIALQPDNTFPTAMKAIIAYMVANAQTVQRNTVGVSTSATGGNIGNSVIVGSVLSSLGVPLEYLFAESFVGTVTGDSQSGTATAFQEPINFVGQQAAASTIAFNYPAGSADITAINFVNALQNQAGRVANFLNNGSFETFATIPNLPDNWHLITGTAGTQTLQSSVAYDGTYCLQLVGGSTATSLFQAFGTDTTQKLSALSVYAFCCWLKVDVVPAAGVLTISLTDGTNTVTTDANSVNNAVTKTLDTLTTTYTPFFGVFRTSKAIPATGLRLQIALTTDLSAGSNLFIDRLALAPMIQLYPAGGAIAGFSGNVPSVIGDSYSFTFTNARNGLLQSGYDVLLAMRSNNLILPSVASSPTISDSLVS